MNEEQLRAALKTQVERVDRGKAHLGSIIQYYLQDLQRIYSALQPGCLPETYAKARGQLSRILHQLYETSNYIQSIERDLEDVRQQLRDAIAKRKSLETNNG